MTEKIFYWIAFGIHIVFSMYNGIVDDDMDLSNNSMLWAILMYLFIMSEEAKDNG